MIVMNIAAVSLTITSVFGIIIMLGIQNEAKAALTDQAQENLSNVIETKTALADLRLRRYADIVDDFTYYVEELMNSPQNYKPLDLTADETYNTGDCVYSFALATEEYDWNELKGQAELFANVAQRFCPVVESNRNVIKAVYFGFDNGLLLSYDDASEKVPPELMYYDFLSTDWYALGKSADDLKYTEPYPDSFGRGLTVTCVRSLKDAAGNVVGVLGMDMGITDIYNYVLDLDLGDDVSAFIADANGHIISLDNEEMGETTEDKLRSADVERMTSNPDGITVRDNTYYAFDTIESVNWKLCVRVPQHHVRELADTIGQSIISAIIMFIIFALTLLITVVIVVFEFSEKITKPLTELTKDVGEISSGKLDHRAEIHDNDEIGDLAEKFNEMAGSLKEHISKVTKMTAEKERVSAELGVAAKIQNEMMPKNFPKRDDLIIHASMTPAKEVGGDFYDFFMIDPDRICLVIADVSGKGVPAALFMVIAKTLMKIRTTAPGTPSDMMWDINNTLCADNSQGLFVTAWFGILTLSTGELASVNAGHEYPAIRHKDGEYELIVSDHMPPLAAEENIRYNTDTIKLRNGDELFLYTDGVPEAKNAEGQRFGTEKMLELLNGSNGMSPEDKLDMMRKEIYGFTGGEDLFDDVTMMSFIWKGN